MNDINERELTPEYVKEFNLTEFKLKHNQLNGEYTTLVLSSMEEGTSFKPFPVNALEKETLLWDIADSIFDGNIDRAVALYELPDFCFCYTHQSIGPKIIQQIIKDGHFENVNQFQDENEPGRPHCPYA